VTYFLQQRSVRGQTALMGGRLSSQVIAGREGELAEVRAAFERAAGGSASAVLIGGEAGVGKTRLLTELTAHAHDAGALVLLGRCADLRDADMPLLPIAEALAALGPMPAGASAELEDAWRGRAPGVAVFHAGARSTARGISVGRPSCSRSTTCTGPTAQRSTC
jgi:AAA ATPase domain